MVMKLDDSKRWWHRQEMQKKSLNMRRERGIEEQEQQAKLLYYGMFSVGVLLLAFAGDIQSMLDEAIAAALMIIAAFRLRNIRKEEEERTEEKCNNSSRFSEWQNKSSAPLSPSPLH
jgi:hypothetical protein